MVLGEVHESIVWMKFQIPLIPAAGQPNLNKEFQGS